MTENTILFPGTEPDELLAEAGTESTATKVVLLGLDRGQFDADRSMAELSALPTGTAARILATDDACAAESAAHCAAEAVVTCGLDARCTLTPSSLLPGGEMAALQREMTTLSGAQRLPQELSLPPAGSAAHRLLLAAALLALGEEAL